MRRAPDLATLRALWWTRYAVRDVRRSLRRRSLPDVMVPRPPRLPEGAFRGVRYALRKHPGTCLEEALVLQAWNASQGRRVDVILGVTGSSQDFGAHAWLDGEAEDATRPFQELVRLSPR